MKKIKKPLGSIMLGYGIDLTKQICDPVLYDVLSTMNPALVNKLAGIRRDNINNESLITQIGNSINVSVRTNSKFNE